MIAMINQQIANIQQSAISDPRFKHNEDVEVTPAAKQYIDTLFKSMLPHFPAWRQSVPTDEDLGRLKSAWAKAVVRHSRKVGKKLNIKAGLLACEESETDWMPSVGRFISWCEQSSDLNQFAQRALDLFNSGQKQIDNIGKMVTGKYGFDLKLMKSVDTNKKFIEYYLMFAEDNEIESLEAYALTETVQLSIEQQREADNRAQAAQNQFLSKFSGVIVDKPKETVKNMKSGLKLGKIKSDTKQSLANAEKEKARQLKAIKDML
jgi:hypothetical protein